MCAAFCHEGEGKGRFLVRYTVSQHTTVINRCITPCLCLLRLQVAAAIRFAAITALATMLRRRLLTKPTLTPLLSSEDKGSLLPLLLQCLDEDWYSDVRFSSCYVVEQMLVMMGADLGDGARRALYPELLKRLDDSNDQVGWGRGNGAM